MSIRMIPTELMEIKEYWSKKYPSIFITLFPNQDGNKFLGRMIGSKYTVNLSANTIDEIISQGEAFLRMSI